MWSCQDLVQDLKKIHSFEKFTVYAAEEFGFYDKPKEFLNPTAEPIWILGGAEPEYYSEFPGKTVLWHTFFLYWACISLNEKYYNKNSEITKIYISMNHRAHRHRCILLDTLAEYNMIDKGFISWHDVDRDPYEFKYWKPKILKFKDGFLKKNTQHTLPNIYSNALINLVSESTTETVFVTEKTYHAIFAEKPFIIHGAPGIHQYLNNLGFELYDEIFDYSFDEIKDDKRRAEMIVKNLKKLEGKNLNYLKKILDIKAKHNKQIAMDIIKSQEYIPDEVYGLKYYADTIKEAKCKSDSSD